MPRERDEDDDAADEINLSDGQDDGDEKEDEDGEAEAVDRGDEVAPESTPERLRKLADEDEDEEGDDEGGADDGAADDKPSSARIPKARFDEVNERRIRAEEEARLLREENERMRAGSKPADKATPAADPVVDLKELRKQQRDALMEGDADKAAALDEQIDTEMERRATERVSAALRKERAQEDLTAAAVEVIGKFPFLDSRSSKANAEAMQDVFDLRAVYERRGMKPADALKAAAAKVGPLYERQAVGKTGAAESQAGRSRLDDLRAARLRRNAAAANAIPPRLEGGSGNRTGQRMTVADLNDDATFASLSEKEKRRLRGDAV